MPGVSPIVHGEAQGTALDGRSDQRPAAGPPSVPDVVAPPPRHPRFPLIDGMRAIAVLSVVGVHTAVAGAALSTSIGGRLLAHLNIGVTIFFLISGFLLYRPMIAHRAGGAPAPKAADYAKRRFLRIYPAYWVVLTILVVAPGLTGVVDGHWWPMYAMVHTLPVYDGRGCIDLPNKCGLAQTWSLVVEATFYVALPLYAFAIARLTRRLSVRGWMRTELVILGILSTLSVTLQYGVSDPVPAWLGRSVAGYVLWFALGMGMAVISVGAGDPRRQPRPIRALAARPGILWAIAAATYLVLCLRLPDTPFIFARSQQLAVHVCFGVIAALLLAPAIFGHRSGGLPRRLLAQPIIAWLGLVSYGIFLWHYVVTLKLGPNGAKASYPLILLGTLAISIACAAVSYYAVERPLLRLKYHRLQDYIRRPARVAEADR